MDRVKVDPPFTHVGLDVFGPWNIIPAPLGDSDIKDLYKKEWRQVQCLANAFWKAWRRDYLATLQVWRKWTEKRRNLEEGDVVLLKDSNVKCNLFNKSTIANHK